MKAQDVIRLTITIFILVLCVLSVLGMVWWRTPPEPLHGYIDGGLIILGILLVSAAFGLWVLWKPVRGSR